MAHCKQTPQEFIKNAFTPQIAVTCTPSAEQLCRKNNLNFIELLQPFTRLTSDLHYRDPIGSVVTIRNLKLTFLDVNSRPPQATLARKLLNSSVSEVSESKTENLPAGGHQLNLGLSTPWFESWRETFLKVQYPSDHEYTKHFLSCILVASSGEDNPVESIIQSAQGLIQMQSNAPGKLPKWFSSNILKYYVIVHDNVEGNVEKAHEAYESLKVTYGEANCFLLKMNSRPPGETGSEYLPDPWNMFINKNVDLKDSKTPPESSPYTSSRSSDSSQEARSLPANFHPLSPDNEDISMSNSIKTDSFIVQSAYKSHGHCLSTEDVENVKLFLYEFCKSCLLPYIERQLFQLNDAISNKKGVSRSLFSATKRWFNPNKPGAGSVAINNLMYAPDSPELQVRRLGDLYFMFGHYSFAFQAYHLAKRDYNTDQAWLYYAGALEMASLAAFMTNESNRKTCDYIEESITTYLNTCKMPQFATRATLLSSECLKSRGLYGEAAHQFIRMTSEESDLRSALFLEQAALCFLHSKMVRKYAFHMVLAGHRFSKAAQRRHSLRSYKQAYQVYEDSGWDLAEDHINYTIGRQAHNLHSFDVAVKSFGKLLKGDSKQSAQQQGIFLKEYLTILGNKLKKEGETGVPLLVLPEMNNRSLKLLMGPTPPLTTPGKVPAMGISFADKETSESTVMWHRLEEMMVQEAQGPAPIVFKPMLTLHTVKTLKTTNPVAIVNEPIQVCLHLTNSLQIVIHVKDMYLMWSLKTGDGEVVSNESNDEESDYVKTHVTKSILIPGSSNQTVVLSVTPLVTGAFTLKGVYFTLVSSTTPSDSIFIKGKQLFTVKSLVRNYPKDASIKDETIELDINVVPLAPCLQVSFSEISMDFLCDEVQKVVVDFRNTGTMPLHKVYMATSMPELLSDCDFNKNNSLPFLAAAITTGGGGSVTPALREKMIRESHITCVPLPDGKLEPEQSTTLSVYLKAPSKPGPCPVDLLIYYESVDGSVRPRYRLVRHKWNLSVQESVSVELKCQESHNGNEEIALVMKSSNMNKIHSSILTEVGLTKTAMLSQRWKLTGDVVTPKFINLKSQEAVHFLLKAARMTDDKKGKYSTVTLAGEQPGSADFSQAYMSFASKTEQRQLNLHEGDHLKRSANGYVFLQWQALVTDANRKRIVCGQTEAVIENIRGKEERTEIADDPSDPANLLEANILKERNAQQEANNSMKTIVTYRLAFPHVVEHNFQRNKLCVVPVTLFLHSIETLKTLEVCINTLGTPSTPMPKTDLFSPYASNHFVYVGISRAVRTLDPLSSQEVNLSVAVTRPGVFELGSRLQISCSYIDSIEAPILQTCQIKSALIVVDGNS